MLRLFVAIIVGLLLADLALGGGSRGARAAGREKASAEKRDGDSWADLVVGLVVRCLCLVFLWKDSSKSAGHLLDDAPPVQIRFSPLPHVRDTPRATLGWRLVVGKAQAWNKSAGGDLRRCSSLALLDPPACHELVVVRAGRPQERLSTPALNTNAQTYS